VRGQKQDREDIPSLKVMAFSETVRLPQQLTNKPVFENQQVQISVTNGRPGGLNNGEDF
jgi:tyrosinase